MIQDDLLEQCLIDLESSRETRERDEITGFGESIHNHQNGGETIREGEFSDKINE